MNEGQMKSGNNGKRKEKYGNIEASPLAKLKYN
jgi:hypothetical protein